MKIDSYGVIEKNNNVDPISLSVENIKLLGYAVVESGYDNQEINEIKKMCLDLSIQYKELYKDFKLDSIAESNIYRAPLLQNTKFVKIAMNQNILRILNELIVGEVILNQQNLVINPPTGSEYTQRKWHRDLPYQHYTSSRPIAINALYAVDDFTVKNGATFALPASHKMSEFPSQKIVEDNAVQVEVKAGSFLVLDCMLFHAAAENLDVAQRIGLNHVYSSPMLRQQIDYGKALNKDLKSNLSEDELKFIGAKYSIPGSVAEYLQSRR